jgi:hypothetical protein
MQWSLIKTWAKEHGYTSFREKTKDPNNPNDYDYYWGREDNPSVTGMTNSLSKLATDIYNHLTDYEWIEYQEQYKTDKIAGDITYD